MDIISTPHIQLGRAGSQRIDLYADTHIGSRNVDDRLLARHIAETKESGNLWCGLDDFIDGIVPTDRKRFDQDNVAQWVLTDPRRAIANECEHWADLFSPIASQCVFAIAGDKSHYHTEYVSDPMGDMLAKLGIRRATGTVYMRTMFRRTGSEESAACDLVMAHGSCGASTNGAKVNYLERKLQMFPRALGFFCGHGHTKVVAPPHVGLIPSGSHMVSVYRRAAMTGGYLLTYAEDTTGYGERKLYQPSALGRITVVLRPFGQDDQRVIEVENA